MLPIFSLLPARLRGESRAIIGDCLVCSEAVREGDDRMRVHGRNVHTACAGYRLRRTGRSRSLGSRELARDFTGD